MNNNKFSLASYLLDYSEASKKEDFEKLFDSLSHLSFEDFLRFIKRTSCYQYHATYKIKVYGVSRTITVYHPEHFWNSTLTLRWAKELFCSEYAEELLFGFFSKTENYNQRLLKEIAHHNPRQLVRSIKLKKCFLEEELFSMLTFLKLSANPFLNSFYEEISALKKLDEEWLREKTFHQSVLDQFSIEEILVHTVSYFEKFKRSSYSHLGNRAHLVSMEVCLIAVLNNILNERRRSGNKVEGTLSIPEIYSLIDRELPPLNTAEGIIRKAYLANETISDTKRLIREALEFYFSYLHGFLYQVDKYCVGLADVVEISNEGVCLSTNTDYQYFKRDDKKNSFVGMYFTHLASESEELMEKNRTAKDMNEREENLRHAAYMKQLEFMKKNVVKHKRFEIKPEEMISFLWNLSHWIMPQGRTITAVAEEETKEGTWVRPVTFKRQIPDKFRKLFPQGYFVAFDHQVLIKSCEEYFGWERNKCEAIVDYLTLEMTNSQFTFDFPEYPFIKVGSTYLWLSTFLRDRHWFNILSCRFHRAIHQDQSKQLEIGISQLFIDAGFSAVASVDYKDDEVREIDCLAYKDGCLFVVELKTTYPSEDLIRQSEFDSRRLEHKAVNQLERALKYYESNFDFFRNIQGLKIDREQKHIHVYPLIVTNTFERDKVLKNMKHLKISLFELTIALKNDLYKMLNSKMGCLFPDDAEVGDFVLPFHASELATNPNNPFLKKEKIDTSKEACDLYHGTPVTASGFIDVIAQDKVWKFLDRAYNFNVVEKINLKKFDKEEKWLT